MLNKAVNLVILPAMDELIRSIRDMAEANAHIPMLSRTHGQVIELSFWTNARESILLTGHILMG